MKVAGGYTHSSWEESLAPGPWWQPHDTSAATAHSSHVTSMEGMQPALVLD